MSAIVTAATPEHYAAAKALMLEYRATSLAEDYAVGGCGLDEELASFPGPYAPPSGFILLATLDGVPCGCLALRAFTHDAGEVMRMFVQPHARGKGLAEQLMRALITKAPSMGYSTLNLDSLHRFKAAHKLYEKLGFTYCEPYNPEMADKRDHMVFMRLPLAASVAA
ncbi:GNAT family N-acetyltransferase [Methylocystis sp.]|uniref:GNAT family N-acetyltransferase n=1 Tax=Methylocystis sp. TaxID=1911079 RepID=UPI003DA5532A